MRQDDVSIQEIRRLVAALVGCIDAATKVSHHVLHSDLLRMNSCVCDEEVDLAFLKNIVDEANDSINALGQEVADASSALREVARVVEGKASGATAEP